MMLNKSVSSTFGFDILIPKQSSVVSEKRLYPLLDFAS